MCVAETEWWQRSLVGHINPYQHRAWQRLWVLQLLFEKADVFCLKLSKLYPVYECVAKSEDTALQKKCFGLQSQICNLLISYKFIMACFFVCLLLIMLQTSKSVLLLAHISFFGMGGGMGRPDHGLLGIFFKTLISEFPESKKATHILP